MSSTPPELDVIANGQGALPPVPSSPPSWSGLSTQSNNGAERWFNLAIRAGALLILAGPWTRAADSMTENGRWVPFAAISAVGLATSAPEALAVLARALAQVLPFVKK